MVSSMHSTMSSQCRSGCVGKHDTGPTLVITTGHHPRSVEIMEPDLECRLKDTIGSDTPTLAVITNQPCGSGVGFGGCKTTSTLGNGLLVRRQRPEIVLTKGQRPGISTKSSTNAWRERLK